MFKTKIYQAAKRATAALLVVVFLASNLLLIPAAQAASLTAETDTLGTATPSTTSSHTLAFVTQTALATGDTIELYFQDFSLALDATTNVTVTTGPTDATVSYSNTNKLITLTIVTPFVAGNVALSIITGKITNPAIRGEYPVSIVTRDSTGLEIDSGLALANVTSQGDVSIVLTSSTVVGGGSPTPADTTPPTLSSITIASGAQYTADSTPPITISAANGVSHIAFSCDGGSTWGIWIAYPDSNIINPSNIQDDFDITTGTTACSTSSGSKTITAKLKDAAGNESTTVNDSIVYDAATVVPTLSSPAANSYGAPNLTIDFNLPEAALANSVTLTFTRTGGAADASSPHAFTLASTYETAGSHTFAVTVDDDWTDEVAIAAATGASDQLIDGTIYDVMLSYRDIVSSPVASTTNSNFTFDASTVTSTIAIVDGTALTSYSVGTGSATLNGSATTPAGQITEVKVSLQRSSDGRYYNGTSWQLWAAWLVADSRDSAFDTNNETWEYRGLAELTDGESYVLRSRATKTGGVLQAVPTESTFSYAPVKVQTPPLHSVGSSNGPDIGQITAGPDSTDRISLIDGEWWNYTDAGEDDAISFTWVDPESADDDTFYYVIDDNVNADSLKDTELALASDSSMLPYLDKVTLAEGESYLHVRAQSGDGAWGPEQVFTIKYDTTPPVLQTVTFDSPSGTYRGGDTLAFTVTFAEPVASVDGLTISFDSGGQAVIPGWETPTDSVTGTYTIGDWADSANLTAQLVSGTITDRADNSTSNPLPTEKTKKTNIVISGARIEVLIPDSDAQNRYSTTDDLIRLKPTAKATKFKVDSTGLSTDDERNSVALDTWLPYQSALLDLVLAPTNGTHKVSITFQNNTGEERTASVLITRLAPNETPHATDVFGPFREEILQYLPDWTAAGLDPLYPDLIEANPALNLHIFEPLYHATRASDDTALQSTIAALNAFIAKLPSTETTEITPDQLITVFTGSEIALEDIFPVGELTQLITSRDNDMINQIAPLIGTTTGLLKKNARDNWILTLRSLGTRDTDSDGLSDRREINLGTNPYLADTDGDSYSDGLEVLDLGTNPLVANTKIKTRFTNLDTEQVFSDPTPLLRGTAPDGTTVKVIAVDQNGSQTALGVATADAEHKWLIMPSVMLSEGNYELRLLSSDATTVDQASVTIDLDFILPPPDFYTDEEYPVFNSGQPVFNGNTYYGSTVVASFQSLLTTTSVVADNPEGDFAVQPSRELAAGEHTLLAYAELPDGTRSATRILKFKIDLSKVSLFTEQTSFWEILSLKNLILFLLLGNFVWILLVYRQDREETGSLT